MSDSTALVTPSDITDPPRDRYRVSVLKRHARGSLVDRGANGGIAGSDVRVMHSTHRRVDVQGLDDHQVPDLPIVTAGGVVDTIDGETILVILGEYAWTGKGASVHSSGQLEYAGNKVDDHSKVICLWIGDSFVHA